MGEFNCANYSLCKIPTYSVLCSTEFVDQNSEYIELF